MKIRKVPITPEMEAAIRRQIDAFRQKFGRDPHPEDPLFFDPDASTPQPYPEARFQSEWDAMLDNAVSKGTLPPEFAYAAKKTGRLVSERNQQYLTPDELQEWTDAVQEFLDCN